MTKKITKEQLESKRDFHEKRVKFSSEQLQVVIKKDMVLGYIYND